MIWLFFAFHLWIVLLWNVGFIIWFGYHAFDWYFDALIITNRAVIDIAWYSFFDKESARVEYGDLKEMNYEIKGFWATILQFGNIFIHLNSGSNISLENVRNPKKVELEITRYKEEFLRAQKMTDSTAIQEILADIIKHHIAESHRAAAQEDGQPEEPEGEIAVHVEPDSEKADKSEKTGD